ncbi:VCBS repeat-containing protein, partial [Actinosynnema sp. NPDC023658]|uniref:C40 family peptidase n=1 Tax=Actinosynnema sp. NPDC023658 TaxID=3155465 RepID=UPI0033F42F42
MRFTKVTLAVAALACVAGLAPAASADPGGGFQIMLTCDIYSQNRVTARNEILTRSQTWIDEGVAYNQGGCHRNAYGNYRMDCSGYVSMVWGLDQSYVTWSLDQVTHEIPRSDLRLGDALNSADHVALFIGWADAAKTQPIVREHGGPNAPGQHTWSAAYANTYTPIRYDRIVEDVAPPKSNDFNGDGRVDIAAIDPGDNLILFAGNGAGQVGWTGPMWPTGSQ